jgi:hypothetical protein
MEKSDLIAGVFEQMNEDNKRAVEKKVRGIVNQILEEEEEMSNSVIRIASLKKELKELQMPAPINIGVEL